MQIGYQGEPTSYSHTAARELFPEDDHLGIATFAAAFTALEGLDLWVLDALRYRPHPTHAHIAQSLEWIARVRPRRAVLTHLNHEVDYAELAARCPDGVEPGYDGLTIELPG